MLDTDLRSNPQSVLDAVSSAAGLELMDIAVADARPPTAGDNGRGPNGAIPTSSTSAAAAAASPEALFESYFPLFESATGWRMEGKYAPMEAQLAAELRGFFAPYNAALMHYLGRELAGWS